MLVYYVLKLVTFCVQCIQGFTSSSWKPITEYEYIIIIIIVIMLLISP
jgi:hypothetical protein